MKDVTRLFDILERYEKKFDPKDDALAGKKNGKWEKFSQKQYRENSDNISYGFLSLGLKKGDKVASISNNRPEWNFLDMGLSQMGAVHVPVYPTISESDYKYILNHADVKYVVVSSKELLVKMQHIIADVPSVREVYTFNETEGAPHYSELLELGAKNPAPDKLREIKASIQPDDLVTIIYTSGTTGNPKGVMLSHRNILTNVFDASTIPHIGQEGRALSFLPLCHVYERMLTYMFQFLGISIYYAENFATIAENAREISPDLFSTVPRFLEKVYDKIMAKGRKLKGVKRLIFFWSVNLGLKYDHAHKNCWWYRLRLSLASKLVFVKWREALGNNLKLMVSGGAALQPRLASVFAAAGISVLEGYGLTETSPVISVNRLEKEDWRIGTVGPILGDTQVKLADDGEILCKGSIVMLGYYKEEEMTKEVIDTDGWFHTGDLGVWVEDKFLKISGRKKEFFKTSMGKYISPQLIENKFTESAFIDALIVVGENQKFAGALIVPDFAHLKSYCNIKSITYTSDEEIVKDAVIRKRFQREIEKFNKELGATEQIKTFALMGSEWSIESGEMTASMKIRRRFIFEKYAEDIRKLFEN